MANSLKIRDDISVRRPVFHAASWTGIITTMVAAGRTWFQFVVGHGAGNDDDPRISQFVAPHQDASVRELDLTVQE